MCMLSFPMPSYPMVRQEVSVDQIRVIGTFSSWAGADYQ
jgi:hypothetical protein